MTNFPPVYCITCRQTPDRKVATAKHFSERDISPIWWQGIHGATWGLRTAVCYDRDHPGTNFRIGPGVLGLLLSHWSLWLHLLVSEISEAIICEDDVILEDGFRDKFRDIMRTAPGDWQFIYIGSLYAQIKKMVSPRLGIPSVPFGTHCYVVKASALPILLETNEIAWGPTDIQIIDRSLPRLNYYAVFPPLADQRSARGEWSGTL